MVKVPSGNKQSLDQKHRKKKGIGKGKEKGEQGVGDASNQMSKSLVE